MNDATFKVVCSHCEYSLPISEYFQQLFLCRIPEDIETFFAFVRTGPGYSRCLQCEKDFYHGLPSAYILSDDTTLHLHPGVMVGLDLAPFQQICSHRLERPVAVVLEENEVIWRHSLMRGALEPHLQLLNMLFSTENEALIERLRTAPEMVGAGFQLALQSLVTGVVRAFAADGAEAQGLRGAAFIPHEAVRDQVGALVPADEAVLLRRGAFALVAGLLARADHQCSVSLSEVLAHPPLLLPSTLNLLGGRIAEVLPVMLEAQDPSTYEGCRTIAAYEGVHAAQYAAASLPNPRVKQWALAYLRCQLLPVGAEGDSNCEIPLTFALATLTFRELYDAALKLTPARDDGKLKISHQLMTLLSKFDAFAAMQLLSVKPDLQGKTPEEWLGQVAVDDIAPHALLLMSGTPDGAKLSDIGRAATGLLLPTGQLELAVFLTVQLTHKLSNTSQNDAALAFLDYFDQELDRRSLRQKLNVGLQATLLTERGNCHRYAGNPLAAHAVYEQIQAMVGEDLSVSDVRVNQRNLAIALRERGRIKDALRLLDQLAPFVDGDEYLQNESSRLVAYVALNDTKRTLLIARAMLKAAGRGFWGMIDMRGAGLSIASVLLKDGNQEEQASAQAILEELHFSARRAGDVAMAGMAAFLLSEASSTYPAGHFNEDAVALVEMMSINGAVRALHDPFIIHMLINSPQFFKGLASPRAILEQFLKEWNGAPTPVVVLAWLELARCCRAENDYEGQSRAVSSAIDTTVKFAAELDPSDDPFHALEPLAAAIHVASSLAVDMLQVEDASIRAIAPSFAELQSSFVLSQRMCTRAGIVMQSIGDIEDCLSDHNIARLIPDGAAMVQPLLQDNVIYLLITSRENGALVRQLLPLDVGAAEWRDTAERMAYRLQNARVTDPRDPLARQRSWQNLKAVLESVILALKVTAVQWVTGQLPTLPVALACPSSVRLAFVPSVLSAIALDAMARRRGVEPRWRPQRVFDAAVWRRAESGGNVAAMRHASAAWEQACQQHHVAYHHATGPQADADSLLQGLAGSDMARIACHGRASSGEFTSEFLVAHQNNLPPSVILPAHADALTTYLLRWEAIANLGQAPAIVLSTACDTGKGIYSLANERLGFERSFLASGTLLYIAPQWPVLMEEVQNMSADCFSVWLNDTDTSLCGVLAEQVAKLEAQGVPSWRARSLSAFGLINL
jgi:tetratricopeptide (TPR) repeat protein